MAMQLLARRCLRYDKSRSRDWGRVNCCLYHARNWYCAHNHVFKALEGVLKGAGYSTSLEMGLTSEGNRISKTSTSAWRSRRTCWWTSPCAAISFAPGVMRGYKDSIKAFPRQRHEF